MQNFLDGLSPLLSALLGRWNDAWPEWTVAGTASENVFTAAAGFDLTAQLAAMGRHWFQGRELDAWTDFYYVRAR